jgi:hypothetical protein
MIPACHSISTLREMLHEATVGRLPRGMVSRVEELERSLDEKAVVSAAVEQEIISLLVLAEIQSGLDRSP